VSFKVSLTMVNRYANACYILPFYVTIFVAADVAAVAASVRYLIDS